VNPNKRFSNAEEIGLQVIEQQLKQRKNSIVDIERAAQKVAAAAAAANAIINVY
jgi:hypothetical protein